MNKIVRLCLLPIRSITNMAQKNKEEKQTYEHYVKPMQVIDNFEEVYKLEHRLIRSYDELYNFYKNEFKPNSFFAWDTETTSLNAEQGVKTGDLIEGKIVGYSFTQDGHIGYYVPVSHPDYSLGYKSLKIFYAMICRSKLNLLYNCRFDMRFLEAMTPEKYDYTPEPDEKIYKFDLSSIKYIDVQNTVWLADTNVAMPSLKKSEKHFLGWNPPTFSETIGDESNFGYLPAEQGYKYASIDALGTYHLFFKTEKYYTESGAAAKLDNDLLYPLMRLENTPINVDHNYLQSMRGDVLKHLDDLKKYLFETAGREYNINSGRELVTIFQQLGIDTGKRTKTGIMETNIKAIEGYVATHGDSEYLSKLVEYKKLLKFDNSYLEKMLEMSEAENVAKHPIRFCYFTNRVPCLTENNQVLIKDRGLISIKECKEGDYIWTQYGYKKILWNNSHYANDVYKVTFKNGYTIEGTGHHPVLVNKSGRSDYLKYEWAGLSDLKVGEHIVINHKPCDNYDSDIEYEFARLIGFIDGDGSIATYDRVKLCYWTKESDELKEYYGNLLSKYSGKKLHYDLSQQEPHSAIVQVIYSTKFNKQLRLLGVRGDGVPKLILNSSPKIWLAYLHGIWDADGNISLHKDNRKCPQVGIKLIKKQTVRDIGMMLTMLGIPNSFLDINWYKNKPNLHEQLRCRIKDHIGYVLFKNLISDYLKSNKKLKFESLNIGNEYKEYAQTKVVSVEKINNTTVYDIEVEDVHEYIANGIVTHNTGRLASGTDGKNSYFSKLNFQSLPKPHSHNYHVHKATPEQIANGEDLCGYIFNDDPNGSLGLTEGQDPHLNVRKAFRPINDDSVVVSVDMCAEELRLVANIYKEQTWIKAFNNGQDVHKSTACKIFGEENYCKEARKKAKAASFGILYGSSAYGFHNQFPDMTLDECEEFIEKFKAALPSIEAGQKASVRYAKKNGYVKTYFGRPRRVKYYLNHPDRSMRSFGERTVKNTAVQGAAGDCLKLMVIRLWKELFSKYPEIKWVGSIHDEITYIIPKSILINALKIIKKCQTIKLPDWPVQLDCDISIGKSFGELIPWFLDDETGELTPQIEEIKHEQVEEKSENKVSEYDMLLDADEYDYLR